MSTPTDTYYDDLWQSALDIAVGEQIARITARREFIKEFTALWAEAFPADTDAPGADWESFIWEGRTEGLSIIAIEEAIRLTDGDTSTPGSRWALFQHHCGKMLEELEYRAHELIEAGEVG